MKKLAGPIAVLCILVIGMFLTFGGDAIAAGWHDYWEDARFRGDVWINDDVIVDDSLSVVGPATYSGGVTHSGTVTQSGSFVLSGASTVSGNIVTTKLIRYDQTTETVTAAEVLTPTTNVWLLTSAGTVTPTLGVGAEGQLVTLINSGSNSIIFADTGIQKLGGTRTLGATDTLSLVSDGTNWYEIALGNN